MTQYLSQAEKLKAEQFAGRRALRVPLLMDYWDDACNSDKRLMDYLHTGLSVEFTIPRGTDVTVLTLKLNGEQVFQMQVTFEEVNPWRVQRGSTQSETKPEWANPPVLPELMLAHIALLSNPEGNK